jgi:hypothetical protein
MKKMRMINKNKMTTKMMLKTDNKGSSNNKVKYLMEKSKKLLKKKIISNKVSFFRIIRYKVRIAKCYLILK